METNNLKENSVSSTINKGRELFESGNYVEAKDIFENLYKVYPDNKEIQSYLGMVFFKLGLHKEAERLYKNLLEKSPDSPSLHFNLGIIYYKEGLLDIAVEKFLKTVEFDPGNNRAQNYLGLIYTKKGHFDKALERFSITKSKKMIKEVQEKIRAAKKTILTMPKEGKKAEEKGFAEQKGSAEQTYDSKEKVLKGKEKLKIVDTKQDVTHLEEKKPFCIKETAERLRKDSFKKVADTGFIEIYQNLVKLNITDMMYTRLSLLESFSGSLNFTGAYRIIQNKLTDLLLGEANDPIFRIFGNGSLILSIGDTVITPLALNNEGFYVKEKYLLAFEKDVTYENSSKTFAEDFELVRLSGTGMVLLITKNKPITQIIGEENPLAIKLEYLIGWYGDLTSRIIRGKEGVFKRQEDSKWTMFKGNGYVFCLIK
jgi:hypothetical protein